jgi:hypothetical protein
LIIGVDVGGTKIAAGTEAIQEAIAGRSEPRRSGMTWV